MKSGYLLLVLAGGVAASDLPDCPQDQSQRYHNCYGTDRFYNGYKYVSVDHLHQALSHRPLLGEGVDDRVDDQLAVAAGFLLLALH